MYVVDVVPAGGGARRVLHIDREEHAILRADVVGARGDVLRRIVLGDFRFVGDRLRPFHLAIREPRLRRTSTVHVEERSPEVPLAHLDPDRFYQP